MKVLLTGCAGFIGFHAAHTLLAAGHDVIGVDNLNTYYDVGLKRARLNALPVFEFHHLDISEAGALDEVGEFTHILHLAAQAGVRHSLERPRDYVSANVMGQLEVLELARRRGCAHLVYASSSSVYGEQQSGPFAEHDPVRTPNSLYAATKIGAEMMAESYARLFDIPMTGLRFFTVYGPWGRPDMAYWKFTKAVFNREPLTLFDPDAMMRDFTYVDDIVEVLPEILERPTKGHAIYNLGNSSPHPLMDLVRAIEATTGRTAELNICPRQPGDVSTTFAGIGRARDAFGFAPDTTLADGIQRFVDWYRSYANSGGAG